MFLDVLEPYVLNDRLKYVAPEVMAYLIKHCHGIDDISAVVRCLFHMDIIIMKFDWILTLLRENEMCTALLHVYASGLNDFFTPLEIIFEAVLESLSAQVRNCLAYRM